MGKAKRNQLARLTALQDRKEMSIAIDQARKRYGEALPAEVLFELRAMRFGS
jgi:hypothetical protein